MNRRRRDGRPAGSRDHLLLIERRALCEPIVVEAAPSGGRAHPTGFWRGTAFHRIHRILDQRWERGESFLRVLADRGCFDLRRVSEMNPWTWRTRARWELVAELAALPVRRPAV